MMNGTRDRGRQSRTWGDDIKEWTNTSGNGIAKRVAENRVGWRGLLWLQTFGSPNSTG